MIPFGNYLVKGALSYSFVICHLVIYIVNFLIYVVLKNYIKHSYILTFLHKLPSIY